MTRRVDSAEPSPYGQRQLWFTACFGTLLGLALVKFGNPPIMEKWVTAPTNTYEVILGSPWPITWGYGLLALVALLGLRVAKWAVPAPLWLFAMPLAWLFWQCLASVWTVDADLTRVTLAHFTSCVVCFYLGFFCLAPFARIAWFWPGVLCGFLILILVGWQQHFGGL